MNPIPSLSLPPLAVAAGLRHLPGLVFFDSALPGRGQLSIVGARPSLLFEHATLAEIEAAMGKHQGGSNPAGWPASAAIGFVEYEGAATFGFYDELLIYEHDQQLWHGSGDLLRDIRTVPDASSIPPPIRFRATLEKDQYCRLVRRAQAYIAAGDIYQVNIAQPFTAAWTGDPFALFQSLRQFSPALTPLFSISAGGKSFHLRPNAF